MKKTLAIVGLVGALAFLVPMAAEAGGRHRHHRSGHCCRPVVVVRAGFPVFWPYYYAPYRYSPYVYYTPPPVYYSAPPVYYSAPPVSYSEPQTPQFEREVVFPTGRYVLEGDGVRTAYRWVWVPNPPPPPSAPPAQPETR